MSLTCYYRNHALSPSEQRNYDVISRGLHEMRSPIRLVFCPPADLQRVYEALLLDQPDLFYLASGGMQYAPSKYFKASYLYSPAEAKSRKARIEQIAAGVQARLHGKSDLEKELYIHDYLVRTVRYDHQNTQLPQRHTIEGALLDGQAVCSGYAKAFLYLAQQAGLDCMVARGSLITEGNQPHAWNIVCLDGNACHVDVTNEEYRDGFVSHAYFNLSDRRAAFTLTPDHFVRYPACPRNAMIIPRAGGTEELLRLLRTAAGRGKKAAQAVLNRHFPTGDAVIQMLQRRLKPEDAAWYDRIAGYHYAPSTSVLTVYFQDQHP